MGIGVGFGYNAAVTRAVNNDSITIDFTNENIAEEYGSLLGGPQVAPLVGEADGYFYSDDTKVLSLLTGPSKDEPSGNRAFTILVLAEYPPSPSSRVFIDVEYDSGRRQIFNILGSSEVLRATNGVSSLNGLTTLTEGLHVYTCSWVDTNTFRFYIDDTFDNSGGVTYRTATAIWCRIGVSRTETSPMGRGIWKIRIIPKELTGGNGKLLSEVNSLYNSFSLKPAEWVSGGSYSINDAVMYNRYIYYARTNHSSIATVPSSDTTNWAREWRFEDTYTTGDIVGWGHYEGSADLYQADTDHSGVSTTPDADGTNWTAI